jgi:diguanylate cyclase (GGDEF)-like protein
MEAPKGRILVVDDDKLNRIKLSVNLQEAGCEVVLAENGAQALELLYSQPFDTVLLDLMMPVMDGFAVLEQVRAHETLRHVPIIVISAEEDLGSVVQCIEMGAADYLAKPFNSVLLRARINACLQKKHLRDREIELYTELELRYQQLQELHEKVREQAGMLKELSIRDGLTGLYNRRHFDEQAALIFAQACRYDRPLTIMIGDIDYFKRVNDRFSHAVGDEVLGCVARILQDSTRESDIVARYGGEEFVIALAETPLTQACSLCEKLRNRIEAHPWQEIHPELCVTMSMGLSADRSLGSFEKMVAAADKKLYEAKSSGRNRVCAEAYESV